MSTDAASQNAKTDPAQMTWRERAEHAELQLAAIGTLLGLLADDTDPERSHDVVYLAYSLTDAHETIGGDGLRYAVAQLMACAPTALDEAADWARDFHSQQLSDFLRGLKP